MTKFAHASRTISMEREGVDSTQFFFSFSGAILNTGGLRTLTADLEDDELTILPPTRIGSSSFRPTPQLDFESFGRFFVGPVPTPFPLQIGVFPGPNSERGASINVWYGPSAPSDTANVVLPDDTIIAVLKGTATQNKASKVERYVIDPLLEWMRVKTRQWWIGRSIEGVTGKLHFLAMLDQHGRFVGHPSPIGKFTTPGSAMKLVDDALWQECAHSSLSGRPAASASLQCDAEYSLAIGEFRTGVILACCAIEAARDESLAAHGKTVKDLKISETDLLKHLSTGFDHVLRRNLEREDPALYAILKSYWIARGEAAHGKAVYWRGAGKIAIKEVAVDTLHNGLAAILGWIEGARS